MIIRCSRIMAPVASLPDRTLINHALSVLFRFQMSAIKSLLFNGQVQDIFYSTHYFYYMQMRCTVPTQIMKNFILSSYVHSNLSVVYINKKLGAIQYDFLVGHFLIEQSFRPQFQTNRVPTLDTRITQLVLINRTFLNLKI